MTTPESVLYEESDGIALVTLNRLQTLNVIDVDVLSHLGRLLETARERKSVRAVILTGGITSGSLPRPRISASAPRPSWRRSNRSGPAGDAGS